MYIYIYICMYILSSQYTYIETYMCIYNIYILVCIYAVYAFVYIHMPPLRNLMARFVTRVFH